MRNQVGKKWHKRCFKALFTLIQMHNCREKQHQKQVGNIGNYFDKLYVMNSEQIKIYNLRM